MNINIEFDHDYQQKVMSQIFATNSCLKTIQDVDAGINPLEGKENYPFAVYRSRHRAVAQLEKGGITSGDDANCQSRKVAKTSSRCTNEYASQQFAHTDNSWPDDARKLPRTIR